MASMEPNIYEIDQETGTAKLFLAVDIIPDMFCVWDNYMAVKSESGGVVLYALDTAEQIEDDVITDFVNKNCVINKHVAESTYSIFPAEEEGVYLVCSKGVYRHVIGGTVMEQVINGGLCSLSDPMKHVVKMIRTEEESFMAAFSEGKVSSFAYDPEISTVPSQTLTAYSLTENDILRQAIIRYQGAHPDVYVEYKVGMDEEGGVTREDAVKKLNTEIMAGKGRFSYSGRASRKLLCGKRGAGGLDAVSGRTGEGGKDSSEYQGKFYGGRKNLYASGGADRVHVYD